MNLRRNSRPKPWISKKKGRNERHLKTGKLRKPFMGHISDKRYQTPMWRATREAVLARDPVCVWCLELCKVTVATEADHVIPAKSLDDYEFHDQSNIVGSCRSCNARRAAYEAQGYHFQTKEEWAEFLRKKKKDARGT
jgi:5-methylcytosine-specific restriction endonuclease McrA